MRTVTTGLIPLALFAGLACSAAAEPKLIITSLADSFGGSGNTCAGLVYDYSVKSYVPYIWTRGGGYTRVGGAYGGETEVFCSEDATQLAMNAPNVTDWGSVNCFAGYCFGSMTGCIPGTPLPPPSPCWTPTIAHHWSASTGWVNVGSVPRIHDPATGRYYGGTRCDGTVNYTYGISGDGRYVIGSAWSARLTTASGGPGFGLCGDFVAFRYDSLTATLSPLPVQNGTTISYAMSISRDGSVIAGADFGPIPDGGGGYMNGRRSCVWVNNVQTILDTYSDQAGTYPVNLAGNVIAGAPSAAYLKATFNATGNRLVRWIRQGNGSWAPQNLGKLLDRADENTIYPVVAIYPGGVSDDGNTIVGTACYGELGPAGQYRAFIWRPSINGGKPVDLGDYIASIDPANPINVPGISLRSVTSISADGNAVLVRIADDRNTCPDPHVSLTSGNAGIVYLDGSAIACEPPTIGLSPVDTPGDSYTPFGVALNVWASGSWPLNYQWQREDPGQPGSWIDLTESCDDFDRTIDWDYEGVFKNQLRIGQGNCGSNRAGRYRVVVSNSCGSVASAPANVSFVNAPYFSQQPFDQTSCRHRRNSFYATAWSGGPFTYQWQINDPTDPSGFRNISDGTETAPDGRTLDVSGSDGNVLDITPGLSATGSTYLVRCIATSPCTDPLASNAATYTICDADFNCDGFPDIYDFTDFVTAFETGDPTSDFNGDGFTDIYDFSDFVTSFEAGC